MEQTRRNLLDQLLNLAQSLPTDKLLEALDFVGYLQQRWSASSRPERGSVPALLPHAGTFRLTLDELDYAVTARIAQSDST